MRDLVACGGNLFDRFRIGVRGMSGDEPGRGDVPLAQHREQPACADHAEFAARYGARRAGVKVADPYRNGVEIEREADADVLAHGPGSLWTWQKLTGACAALLFAISTGHLYCALRESVQPRLSCRHRVRQTAC